MNDKLPPEWAIEKAISLTQCSYQTAEECKAYAAEPTRNKYAGNVIAFARYISDHEKAPTDPLLIEAREIAAQRFRDTGNTAWVIEVLEGEHDDTSEVENALTGLRRGIELGKSS